MVLIDQRSLREATRLVQPFWQVTTIATAAGTLSGIATAWLLATINAELHAPEGPTFSLLLRFAALCVLGIGGGVIAGRGNSFVGQKIVAAMRKNISGNILRVPLATVERLGSHRLLAVLTSDVDTISILMFNFPGYAVAFAVTMGSFAYLLWLSPGVFLVAAAATGLSGAISLYSKQRSLRDYEGVREALDDLQKQFGAITEGAKELRINRERRVHVHGHLLSGAADRVADLKNRAMGRFWTADAIGSAIFFAMIGFLLTVERRFGLDPPAISGAILVLLYIRGPVDQLVGAFPLFVLAQVSFRRILALTQELSKPDTALISTEKNVEAAAVRSIELRDARFVFEPPGSGTRGFELGPVNLTIMCGETVFVTGDNGSGKTTLIKLLLGLYRPNSGALLFNGELVCDGELDAYRQLFSAMFSDYYLFDDLLTEDAAMIAGAARYLQRLKIAHKVQITGGRLSTLELSTGQRKRLALVHAYLEQRPIMMLDEWAADQDPTFRHIYYTEILPELKAQGKTLIVVSHDDRYFEVGDRIIRLEHGKVAEDKRMTRPAGVQKPEGRSLT